MCFSLIYTVTRVTSLTHDTKMVNITPAQHRHVSVSRLNMFTANIFQNKLALNSYFSSMITSVYFISPKITNCKFASEGFTICPRTSHRIRIKRPPPPPQKILSWGKKGRNLQESNRGGSLSRMDIEAIDAMWPEGIITELQHIQWVWQSVSIVGSRHGPRSRKGGRGISRAMTRSRLTRQEASDPFRSNGPSEEAELVMCDGEMKIHP